MKTKQFRYNDLGFIRNTGDALQLDLFTAGTQVGRFEINRLICTKEGCITKSSFNKKHFTPAYEKDFLQNVILGKPIFNKQNLLKTEDGFEQNFQSEAYNISYRVNKESIYFKDRLNKILIKIKSLDDAK